MHTNLVVSAVLSALATTVLAAPFEAPYSLSAVHADFQSQLEQVAGRSGAVGSTARVAADLMGPHNATQERLILPILGFADVAADGQMPKDPQMPERLQVLEAELAQIYDSDVDLVIALVDLYAAADEAGQPETARLAERMIWHEVSDVQVLYPAALLVGASLQAQLGIPRPAGFQIDPGPLDGPSPFPMMGVGNPHETGKRN